MFETILGKKANYVDLYDNSLLCPISRKIARDQLDFFHNSTSAGNLCVDPVLESSRTPEYAAVLRSVSPTNSVAEASYERSLLSITDPLPFYGFDIWNCYEVSWLTPGGKPEVRILELIVNSDSPNIIESKSLKLYLNSFNNTKFEMEEQVTELITKDLTLALQSPVIISMKNLESYETTLLHSFSGINLDNLQVTISNFTISQNLPKLSDNDSNIVDEVVYSNLLKSNCLVTNQPDWASVQISYKGRKIDHSSLLKYIIAFRNHNEFHEQCVERIFCDIRNCCAPDQLTVYARYTRRGGIDINPLRSSDNLDIKKIFNLRQIRQ